MPKEADTTIDIPADTTIEIPAIDKLEHRATEPDQDLHERNIEVLSKHFPACKDLNNYVPQTDLVFLDNGEPTVNLAGVSLYGEHGAYTYAEKQLENFWRLPERIRISPPDGLGLGTYSENFIQSLLRNIHETDTTIYQEIQGKQSGHAVVWGVGLAAHLNGLLDEMKCINMLLVEPNLEFIYHSTFIFDWASFLSKAEKQGCTVILVADQSVDAMITGIRNMLIGRNVMIVDGTVMFTHYPNKFFAASADKLRQDLSSFFMALGFAEDEFYMLRQTYKNFMRKDQATLFEVSPETLRDMPAIVVGGGPSKDAYYDTLRAIQDKAIIMSCGSALETLLAENIQPDFHFLVERDDEWFDILKTTSEKYDISDICLVGSTTIQPYIQDFFGQSVFFYRPGLSAFKMFGKATAPGARLVGSDPQVGNAGFAFTLLSGFQEVYLFGLDLGSRDPEKHHSANSFPMQGLADHHELDLQLPATLGGTAYTSNHLLMVRDSIQHMIHLSPRNLNVYNCGDGIVIKGTIPKVPRKLNLPPLKKPKKELIDDLIAGYRIQTREDFEKIWADYDIDAQLTQLGDELHEMINEADKNDITSLFTRLHKYIYEADLQEQQSPMIILRGDLHMMMMAAWFYVGRVNGLENKKKFCEMIGEQLIIAIDTIIDDSFKLSEEFSQWHKAMNSRADS